jgi:flavodoxin
VNIGLIVYSLSGNTLSVAMKLKEKLSAAGHAVTPERIEAVGPAKLSSEDAALKSRPALDTYDAVIFGCPVRGGTPAPPMARYLEQLPSLAGKEVAILVTGFFPVADWGRNQTLVQLKETCESKGARVLGAESVGWFSLNRGRQISRAVDSLSILF